MLNEHYDIVIIGAGPAGMMAAIEACQPGCRIVILEKMHKPALKLKISGKGRCNITNSAEMPDFIARFGKNGRFLKFAFSKFFSTELLNYLRNLGVEAKLERGGRYFPKSDNALEIVNALLGKIKSLNIPLITHVKVDAIQQQEDRSFLLSVTASGRPQKIRAGKVLIATGGLSYPATGSTGDGYALAKTLRHTVTPLSPSLVPVLTAGDTAKKLQGVSLRNVTVSVWSGNRKVDELFGEMLFSRFGITGPVILTLSQTLVKLLDEKQNVSVRIDLKPALDHKKMDERILREISRHSKQSFRTMLKSLLPRKMIDVFIEILNIPGDKPLHQITGEERKRLRMLLKEFPMKVIGHDSYDHAIVTAGGVSLKEIDPTTMESKLVPNLYFAGEVIDVNGETGGFNLQAAWSTAWVAGQSLRRHSG